MVPARGGSCRICLPCGESQDPSHGRTSVPALVNCRASSPSQPIVANCRVNLKTGGMPPKPKKRPAEAPVKPLMRKQLRRQQQPTGSNPANASGLTLPQLKALPAEVLRLYLSSHNLVTTGNVAAMALWLHSALHQQQSDPLPSASVTSQTAAPPLAQLQQSV